MQILSYFHRRTIWLLHFILQLVECSFLDQASYLQKKQQFI